MLLGSVLVLFVAYQLWGTGLLQARSQNALSSDFAGRLEAVAADVDPSWPGESTFVGEASSSAAEDDAAPNFTAESKTDVDAPAAVVPETPETLNSKNDSEGVPAGRLNLAEAPEEPVVVKSLAQRATSRSTVTHLTPEVEGHLEMLYPPDGQALARIVIPAIDVDEVVVAGVGVDALRRGPGHYGFTPLPGQPGNAGIAGHRTTYGAPFGRIDELKVGDFIHVQTLQGSFTYRVTPPVVSEFLEFEVGHRIVLPHEVEVLEDYSDNRLTLTSCHPKYSSSRRIVVQAVLQGDPVVRLPRPGAELETEPLRALADEPPAPPAAPAAAADTGVDSDGREDAQASDAVSPSGGSSVSPDAGSSAADSAASSDAGSADADSPVSADAGSPNADEASRDPAAASSAENLPGAPPTAAPTDGGSAARAARAVESQIPDGFGAGLDGDPRAVAPAVLWGLAAAAVWVAGTIWSRRWRRLPAWSVTVVLFLLVLFAAFTHVDRALPSF